MKYNRAATMFLRYMQAQGNTTAHALTTASADDNLLRRYGSQFRSDTSKQLTQPELTRLRSLVQAMAGTYGGYARHRAAKSFLRCTVPPMPADPNAPTSTVAAPAISADDQRILDAAKRRGTTFLGNLMNNAPLFTLNEINDGLRNGNRVAYLRGGRFTIS